MLPALISISNDYYVFVLHPISENELQRPSVSAMSAANSRMGSCWSHGRVVNLILPLPLPHLNNQFCKGNFHLLFLHRPYSCLWRIFPKSSRRFTQNLLTGTIVCVYHYIRTDDLVSRGLLEMLEEIGCRLHAIRQHWNIVRSVKNGKPRQTSRKRIQGISCDWQRSNATIMQKPAVAMEVGHRPTSAVHC